MQLQPVQDYSGANYPTLSEYFQGTGKPRRFVAWKLAVALAALATMLSGCD
ncbi:MAG: hypothetical protein ABFC96_09675 [Thermoguttaceae bacterium]